MQQGATAKRPARTKRAPAIPYPDLPPTPNSAGTRREIFWRAAWLRDQAELLALQRHVEKLPHPKLSKPLRHALACADLALRKDAEESFAKLVNAGGLLYAWLPE